MKMNVEESEFKGRPMIILRWDDEKLGRFVFQFGLSKAKMIIASIDQIRKFVDKAEAKKSTEEKKNG